MSWNFTFQGKLYKPKQKSVCKEELNFSIENSLHGEKFGLRGICHFYENEKERKYAEQKERKYTDGLRYFFLYRVVEVVHQEDVGWLKNFMPLMLKFFDTLLEQTWNVFTLYWNKTRFYPFRPFCPEEKEVDISILLKTILLNITDVIDKLIGLTRKITLNSIEIWKFMWNMVWKSVK